MHVIDRILLSEALDLHSKSYDFKISESEDIPPWPTKIVFQATFETEQGKEYAVRIFNDKRYGIHSRSIVVMLKKQKKWTQNLVIDIGTFKKVFVTMLKCYDAFKDTAEGKMTSGLRLILQPGIAKTASLIVKSLDRVFKTEPKKKMYLKGANEDGKSNTVELFLANTVSVYEPFAGKSYLPEYESSELFLSLTGTKPAVEDAPAAKTSKYIPLKQLNLENVKSVVMEGNVFSVPQTHNRVLLVFKFNDTESRYIICQNKSGGELRLLTFVKGKLVKTDMTTYGAMDQFINDADTSGIEGIEFVYNEPGTVAKSPSLQVYNMTDVDFIVADDHKLKVPDNVNAVHAVYRAAMDGTTIYYVLATDANGGALRVVYETKSDHTYAYDITKADYAATLKDSSYKDVPVTFIFKPAKSTTKSGNDIDTVNVQNVSAIKNGEITTYMPDGFDTLICAFRDMTKFVTYIIGKAGTSLKSALVVDKFTGATSGAVSLTDSDLVDIFDQPGLFNLAVTTVLKDGEEQESGLTEKAVKDLLKPYTYSVVNDATLVETDDPQKIMKGGIIKILFDATYMEIKVLNSDGDISFKVSLRHNQTTDGTWKQVARTIYVNVDDLSKAFEPTTSDIYMQPNFEEAGKAIGLKPMEQGHIEMLKDSTSSKLKKGDYAKIVDKISVMSHADHSKYSIPKSAIEGLENSAMFIVTPLKYSGKYVALPAGGLNISFKMSAAPLAQVSSVATPTKTAPKELDNDLAFEILPSQNPNAKVEDFDFSVGTLHPNAATKYDLGNGVVIDVQELGFEDLALKMRNLTSMFGTKFETLPLGLKERFSQVAGALLTQQRQYANRLDGLMHTLDLALKNKTKGVADIRDYTGSAYNKINDILRDGIEKSKHQSHFDYYEKRIKGIDSAFRVNGRRFPANMQVYRGASMTNDDIETLNGGGTYTNSSYSSCSLAMTKAFDFAKMSPLSTAKALANGGVIKNEDTFLGTTSQGNKVMLVIDRLDKCLSLYLEGVTKISAEYEILLNRGTVMKCKNGEKMLCVVDIPGDGASKGRKGWFGKMSIVGTAGLAIMESAPKSLKSLVESTLSESKEVIEYMDKCSMVAYALTEMSDYLDELDANSL